jgi:hypothetical protein
MDVVTGYAMVEVLFLVVKVWALVTCLRYPTWAWEDAGHSRFVWMVLLIVGLFVPLLGFCFALWFLMSTSVDVHRSAQVGARPGFPGGP